ncbi:type I polyketide synthase [Oryzibacter oryziterrae]|uniref:type I polyketide synthase n=1 Tax=Oryzibacter oryziterrae TaxID=2766474 RepID=UPI001F28657E|nr:type I polyketide synthase [Oryzibacter oryziterrae]
MSSAKEAIAIVGYSCRLPQAENPETFWSVLDASRCVVSEVQDNRWAKNRLGHPDRKMVGKSYTWRAGQIDDPWGFDPMFFGISPREALQIDPQQRILLQVVWEAFEHAGIPASSLAGSETGVYVGAASVDYSNRFITDPASTDIQLMTGNTLSIVSNRISYVFDLKGPSFTVDTACSSSIVALHEALEAMRSGRIDTAVVGGVNMLLSPFAFVGFSRASMLSPTGLCRAFDADGDGYVRSEGAVAFVLKRLDAAIAAGDPIRGVIVGSGINSDGRTVGLSLPSSEQQAALLRHVYDRFEIDPRALAYVEAHGTGTRVGDPAEAQALGTILGRQRAERLPIGSVKTNIGHLEAASGLAGMLKAQLTLEKRRIPASLHFNTPNPDIDFDGLNIEVVTEARALHDIGRPLHVGINSFGFGGANAHAVIREPAPHEVPRPKAPQKVVPLIVSAQSPEALQVVAQDFKGKLAAADVAEAARLTNAAAHRRDRLDHRLVALGSTPEELSASLEAFLSKAKADSFVAGRAAGRNAQVAFVYSGNGSQWAGMGQVAYKSDATFRSSFDNVSRLFMRISGWSLATQLFSQDLPSEIDRTEIAQPLLFAIQVAITDSLKARGLSPDMVAGHSVGEVAAAWASGALSLEAAVFLIHVRSTQQEVTRDLGGMAALQVSAAEVAKVIDEPDFKGLVLAADNSPRSVTMSGTNEAVADFARAMKKRRWAARKLNLAYPFHSDLIEPIHKNLIDALATLRPRTTDLPFYSTVTGLRATGVDLNAEYWWLNVRNPVLFRQAVEAMADAGARVFIEIGPNAVLKNYVVDSIAGVNRTGACLTSLEQSDSEGSDLFGMITARAIAHGAHVDDERFFGQRLSLPDGLPLYPWQNQPFRIEESPESTDVYGLGPDHQLLGYQRLHGTGPWFSHVDAVIVPWLADHKVELSTVFPAAGFVELLLSAARKRHTRGPLELRDLDILRPLVLEDGEMAEIRTELDAASDIIDVSSRTRLAAAAFNLHVRARVGVPPSQDVPVVTLPAPTGEPMAASALYELTRSFGLHYGPAFQRATSVVPTGERSLLVQLSADQADVVGDARMVLHPTLLDASFHGLFLLITRTMNAEPGTAFLPIRIDELRVFADGETAAFALVDITKASPRSVEASFTLTAADGRVIARAEGVRFKAVHLSRAADPDELTFTTRTIRLAEAGDVVEFPAVWSKAVAHLTDLGVGASEAPDADEASLLIDAGARAVIFETLRRIADPDGRLTFEAAVNGKRVDLSALPLFYRAVEALEEDGALTRDDEGITLAEDAPYPAADTVIATLVATQPDRIAEAMSLVRLTSALGKRFAEGLLSDSDHVLPAALQAHLEGAAPSAAPLHDAVSRLATDLAEQWSCDRPLRMLIVGAEAVAIARKAIKLPTVTSVVIADSDHSRLDLARMAIADQNGLTVSSFDELATSGDRSFDVALTVALGSQPRASETLGRLRQLLADGGLMVGVEPDATLLADLVYGQSVSWWTGSIAPEYPVGTRKGTEGHVAALTAAGFEAVEATSLNSDAARAAILIAKAPQRAAALPATAADPVLILIDGDRGNRRTADALAAVLARRNRAVRVASVHRNTAGRMLVEAIDAGTDADLAALLKSGDIKDVVFQPAVTAPEGGSPLEALHDRVMALHAVFNGAMTPPARLWIVAPGGSGADGSRTIRPVETGVWGLGRVVINEYPGIETRMVDLAVAFEPSEGAERLADLLDAPPAEREIIVDARGRAALRHMVGPSLIDRAIECGTDGPTYRTLRIERQGSLDGLRWHTVESPALTGDQVEIEVAAAGLNFRDVMWALGLLPEEALEDGFAGATLGMECSGVITRVGPDAKRFGPGDRVIAFAPACFATHVTVAEKALAPLPANVDIEAAATIPVTFLTAYYALVELARLDEGETILIHGGAGGVGLAALQIALSRGARVIATAGSPDKRALLRMLGAHDVLDSRSLVFADKVMELTGGQGVDVVLNSLFGEAMERSIECLKPFGRFVELGKRDYYANSRIALRPFRQNLSYFGVDADQLLTHRPKLTERLFRDLVDGFEGGVFTPLPFRMFEADQITDAFRLMQASGHTGKILVRPPSVENRAGGKPVTVHADATYLVAGGLGGFGAETARFLVERGARHLVLASRSGAATEASAPVIEAMRAAGAEVVLSATDLTDEKAVAGLLSTIRSTMPPLKGVLHTAMVIDDALFMNLDDERIRKVMAPKVTGAEILDRLTRGFDLDLFVLYSSATTLIGNPGQASYVAANAYLEGLARARRAAGLPAVAVAWGAIADAGYLARNMAVNAVLSTRMGKQSLTAKAALEGLGLVLDSGAEQPVVAYARIDWATARRELTLLNTPLASEVIGRAGDHGSEAMEDGELLQKIKELEHGPAVKVVSDLLAGEIARILRLPADEIDPARPLVDIGMDSLMAVELRMAAEQKLGVEIPILSLANGGSLADIARRIVEKAHGNDSSSASEAGELVAARHLDGEMDEDVAAFVGTIEENADNLKRLL